MGNKQSGRMLSQDIAKGLCILSVILLHTLAMPVIVSTIIFSVFAFSLSFFFIISGYNYHGMKTSYWKTIWKRFKQLFIPFGCILLGCIIVFGTIGLIFYGATLKDIGLNILESISGNETFAAINPNLIPNVKAFFIPSWFLLFMFVGYVIFYAIADWSLKDNTHTFLSIGILLTITIGLYLPINLGVEFFVKAANFIAFRMVLSAPFIAAQLILGAFLGKKKVFAPKETKKQKGLTILFSLLAFVIATTFELFFPLVGSFAGGHLNGDLPFSLAFGIWEIPLTFVLGAFFTYYFMNFCHLIERIPLVSRWLIFNGQHSMEIYLVHYPLSILIRVIFGLTVDPIVSIPCEFPPEVLNNFDVRYLFNFLLTLVLVDVGVYLYYLVKNKIKNKKQNKLVAEPAN